MKKVYTYYKDNINTYTESVATLKKKIHIAGTVRLLLFLGAVATIWTLYALSWQTLLGIAFLYFIPFALLMKYHNRLAAEKSYLEELILLNVNELKGLDYDFSAFDGASDKVSSGHSFSLDLDLFGNQSLFQSINRTVTPYGKELLAKWFMFPLTHKEEILNRQEAIRELSLLSQFRQHFYVTGSNSEGNKKDIDILNTLTHEKSFFASSVLWKTLIWVIPAFWILILTACALGYINWSVASIYFILCLVISYSRAKQISKLYDSANKMEQIFAIYSKLMECIEKETFHSHELNTVKNFLTKSNGRTASQSIKQLSRHIGGLDQRESVAGIILNILYLRGIRLAISLEQWTSKHAKNVEQWINALAHFDALLSLGGFAFNHPDYIYPEIAETYFKMEGKGLGHPLINRNICVKNDIDIQKNPWFLIITGANMAGKSTYLRTVGVNYLLACVGAPVYAESLIVYPAHLVTSLRTSDSLSSNESYFFAELKRLKMIIDRLKQGEELFIILDEILKGTNSVDKQKGSLALVKQLVSYKTCGIIATHDLVLGSLADEFPNEVRNYRFEADIKNEELSFSYQLREGIAQNMNAYFLMKKMGITV